MAPSAHRVALVSGDGRQITVSGVPLELRPMYAAAAKSQGFEPTFHTARRIEDVESVLAEAAAAGAEAATISSHTLVGAASRVVDFAVRQRWITATLSPWLFDAGLLLYHGPSKADSRYVLERGLQMADRILRGANPAEMPVELPAHVELAINLRAARALGLSLPESLLLRADRVVQ